MEKITCLRSRILMHRKRLLSYKGETDKWIVRQRKRQRGSERGVGHVRTYDTMRKLYSDCKESAGCE